MEVDSKFLIGPVALVGGAGFLGTAIDRCLTNLRIDHRIYDLNPIESVSNHTYVDVERLDSLYCLKDCSTIVHLAAVHEDNVRPPSKYDDVNITGATNICTAARKYDIRRIIFTSSVSVYGDSSENSDETSPTDYINDYGRTKYVAECIFREWQLEDAERRTLIIVRPTVIFGEGNRGNVYNLLKQISSRRFIMFGKGNNRKSMAYVENVAAFVTFCLSLKQGSYTYNYVDKPDMDMNELVSRTRSRLWGLNNVGYRLPAIFGTVIGHLADLVSWITRMSLPISSLRVRKYYASSQFETSVGETGFHAPYSLKDGLDRTIDFEFTADNG